MANYAERGDVSQLTPDKKFSGSRQKLTNFPKSSDLEKSLNAKLNLSARAAKSSSAADSTITEEVHHQNGLVFDDGKSVHDVASMISEWIWTYRNSSKEERGYLIKKGIGFYKSNPAEFFEKCIFDVIQTFKSNEEDETLQWDGLKFIYSSIPRHSIDKLSSASSVSMRSVNSSLSMPSDDQFVRWARQISLVIAQDDECMTKIIQLFLKRRAEESSNAAQQVLRVLCYYQPLLICSFLSRHGNLLKQACMEILDATPRFRASFYSYLVYIIDKTPRSKSKALCQDFFNTQAFVHIVKFLKSYTPVEKKPHKSVIEASKLLARVFDAADAKIAEKYFSAVKFVEALLVTCRRWCAVCEIVRPHFIVVLRALCVHQSVLARSIMFNPKTDAAETEKSADTYTPRACLLPMLLQMSLSGDAEFFTQLIECIRMALGDDFKRNDFVFFEPIDPTNADITMINQLPRLIQNRQMKPEVRIAAARLFSDVIVPESQRVEDFCTSMVRNQDPLQGFLQRTYEQNDPVGVYGTCFAFSRLIAVAHGAASSSTTPVQATLSSSSPDASRSTTSAEPRAHSEQFESEFRAVYDSTGQHNTSPQKQQQSQQCLLLRMLESLDKTRHPVALFGQLQFLVIFERHYPSQLMQFLRRKRILFAIANVITLRGEASVFSRIELDAVSGERAMFSNVNHILALYLLKRCYEELKNDNIGGGGGNSGLAAYCERFLKCDSTRALLKFYRSISPTMIDDVQNSPSDEKFSNDQSYAHDIFKAAEQFLFMPSNSVYFSTLLADLDDVCQRLFAAHEVHKLPSSLLTNSSTISASSAKTKKLGAPESLITNAKALRKQAESKEKRLHEVDAQLTASSNSINDDSNRLKIVDEELDAARLRISEEREQLEKLKIELDASDEIAEISADETERKARTAEIKTLQEKIGQYRDHWTPLVTSQIEQSRADFHTLEEKESIDCALALEHICLSGESILTYNKCSAEKQQAEDEQARAEAAEKLVRLIKAVYDAETLLVTANRDAQRNALLQKTIRQRQTFEANLVVLARRDEVAKKLQSLLVENNVPLPDLDISLYSDSLSMMNSSFASGSVLTNYNAVVENTPDL